MRRRDLKDGMRVLICNSPSSRRILRKSKPKVDFDNWAVLRYATLLSSCREAYIKDPHEHWDLDPKGRRVLVEKSRRVLISLKTYQYTLGRRKKKLKEVVWDNITVPTVDILMSMEDFLPIQKEILEGYKKFAHKEHVEKVGAMDFEDFPNIPPVFT